MLISLEQTEGMMSTKCPKCHAENPDNKKYCGECASPLPGTKEAVHTMTLEMPTKELKRGSVFAGRYEIIEELGEGGMGKIYRVEDTKADEEIALKLIKPEIAADKKTIERFRNELTTARKIAHRNVCRMFDFGEEKGLHYITMEYVAGEDLKSLIHRVKVDIGTTLKIAQQVCEGLSEAHRLGIVHRDLKPSNIMIDKEGDAKIMDFGIARTVRGKGITGSGVMIGTPEYMSPEQVEGEDIDQRSDIYSLGIIMYEILTGRIPFEADTPFAVGVKHKSEIPQNPKEINARISDDLSRAILKCLEKDKDDRYQDVDELGLELERLTRQLPTTERIEPKKRPGTSKEISESSKKKKILVPVLCIMAAIVAGGSLLKILSKKKTVPVAAEITSIAVLAFDDLSPQKDQEYFCDGMTDEIIAKLSALEGLRVISRSSVMRYKNTDKDIKEIGSDLGVEAILEGSVRKEGNEIRVIARLVNVKDRFQLWTDTYDQKLERVFAIQSDIAENIARNLRAELTPETGALIQKKPTENLEAYRLYLQGRYYWNQRTVEALKKAIIHFEQAVETDPSFALAYVGIADSYNMLAGYEFYRPVEMYPKARAAAVKALEIEEDLAEAHTSLAWNKFRYGLDWAGADREFKRAIELKMNSPLVHQWYSMYLLCVGKNDEALAESRRAQELDPLSLPVNTMVGFALFISGQLGEAEAKLKSILEMNPNFSWANSVLGEVYEKKGMYPEAFASFQKAIALYGENPSLFMGYLGHAYATGGEEEKARQILKQLKDLSEQRYISPYAIGIIHLALGEEERAFVLLEEAVEERTTMMTEMIFDHRLDDVRSDPRYLALLKKMGLDENR
jgi:serine/threonine protein kinase/tetratricopeptide (TPR) repeat protein